MPEKPEIVAGLRTAVERGYSLEFAKQSFINAGYSKQDVEDSARALDSGVFSSFPKSNLPQTDQIKKTLRPETPPSPLKPVQKLEKTQPQPPQTRLQSQETQVQQPLTQQAVQPSQTQIQQTKQSLNKSSDISSPKSQVKEEQKKSEKKSHIWIIIVILGIILLLLIGGLLITLFKREWILSLFETIGLV